VSARRVTRRRETHDKRVGRCEEYVGNTVDAVASVPCCPPRERVRSFRSFGSRLGVVMRESSPSCAFFALFFLFASAANGASSCSAAAAPSFPSRAAPALLSPPHRASPYWTYSPSVAQK